MLNNVPGLRCQIGDVAAFAIEDDALWGVLAASCADTISGLLASNKTAAKASGWHGKRRINWGMRIGKRQTGG